MKALRFGFDSGSNIRRAALGRPLLEIDETARSFLSTEIGQLLYLIDLLATQNITLPEFVDKGYREKYLAMGNISFIPPKIIED